MATDVCFTKANWQHVSRVLVRLMATDVCFTKANRQQVITHNNVPAVLLRVRSQVSLQLGSRLQVFFDLLPAHIQPPSSLRGSCGNRQGRGERRERERGRNIINKEKETHGEGEEGSQAGIKESCKQTVRVGESEPTARCGGQLEIETNGNYSSLFH